MFTGSGYLFSVVCWVPPSAPFMNMNTRTRLMEFSVHCWYLPRIHNTMITVLNLLNFDINIFKKTLLHLSCKLQDSGEPRKLFADSLKACEKTQGARINACKNRRLSIVHLMKWLTSKLRNSKYKDKCWALRGVKFTNSASYLSVNRNISQKFLVVHVCIGKLLLEIRSPI